jgi:hypothetical protein
VPLKPEKTLLGRVGGKNNAHVSATTLTSPIAHGPPATPSSQSWAARPTDLRSLLRKDAD